MGRSPDPGVMKTAIAFIGVLLCARAEEAGFAPQGPLLPSPARSVTGPAWRVEREEGRSVHAADYEAWYAAAVRWRTKRLAQINYSGAEYARPELQWTQCNFIQPQMMVEDR